DGIGPAHIRFFWSQADGFPEQTVAPAFLFHNRTLAERTEVRLELLKIEEVRRIETHTDSAIYGLAVSPNGKQALSSGVNGTVRLWDLGSSKEVRSLKCPSGMVHGVAFLPDGRRALTGNDRLVLLWDLTTGEVLRRFEGHTSSVGDLAVAPD